MYIFFLHHNIVSFAISISDLPVDLPFGTDCLDDAPPSRSPAIDAGATRPVTAALANAVGVKVLLLLIE